MTRPRALVHVESLLGIGHGVRAAGVTQAMLRRGFDVTLVSGSHDPNGPQLAGARFAHLPTVKAADAAFSRLVDENGSEIDDTWHEQRRAALLEVYRSSQPQVIVIEGFPFSRWQFRFELTPLIAAAKGQAAIVCSVRDILVAKRDPRRIDAIVELIRNDLDMVLVHGDKALVDFGQTFPAAARIADKLRYTGYVSANPAASAVEAENAEGDVLVSAGGGAVGNGLLRTALEARASGALKERTWRFLTGRNLPDRDMCALEAQAEHLDGVIVERFRHDLPLLLTRCGVSISQAGYNTIVDLLAARARAVVVPFSSESETEQTLRARLLEEHGLLTVMPEAELSAQSLATVVADVAASPRPPPSPLSLDGAQRSADLMYELASARRQS
jgi:predicted glycosyltransferase